MGAVNIDSIVPKIDNKQINNNIVLTTDIEDNIDYSIKSNYLNFLKEKLDIKIEEENIFEFSLYIIKINKLKYKSDNTKLLKYNKFVISLNNINQII